MNAVDAAVIVAGGHGRRLGGLGGVDKPGLRIGDRTLIEVAVAAVAGAQIGVVGPDRALPGVTVAREDPPGSGPAAAVVAGLHALAAAPDVTTVAVLAADLPGLTAGFVAELGHRLGADPELDGVLATDRSGRRQWLLGVWRLGALRAAAGPSSWADRGVRELLAGLEFATVPADPRLIADLDTPDDLARWNSSESGEPGEAFQSPSQEAGP